MLVWVRPGIFLSENSNMANQTEFRPVRELATGVTEALPQINVSFSNAAETAGNSISTTIQVREWNENLAGVRALRVWYATTAGGAPSDTGNTVTVGTGTTVAAVLANACYDLLTDTTGKIVIANVVAGAATRYLNVALPGGEIASVLVTYAA
jgi:hypothetical protein